MAVAAAAVVVSWSNKQNCVGGLNLSRSLLVSWVVLAADFAD